MASPPAVRRRRAAALAEHDYLADEGLATAIFLADALHRPLLLEGEAGVGKTEVAKVLLALDRRRARPPAVLRGHRRRARPSTSGTTPASCCTCAPPRPREGGRRDDRRARGRALLRALPREAAAAAGDRPDGRRARRRCCSSTRSTAPTTSSRRSCSRSCPTTRSRCPSSARSAPTTPPIVVLTSNRTRDVHDALKRRCLYHWVEHPDFEREVAIVRLRAPEVPETLARQVAGGGRGAARARALQAARASPRRSTGRRRSPRSARAELDEATVDVTLGTVLKYREDQERVRRHGVARARAAGRRAWPSRGD